jgi:hypothetical protein
MRIPIHNSPVESKLTALTVAVRVLTAINEMRQPNEVDAERLRHFSQLPPDTEIDEIACDVIKHSLRQSPEAGKPFPANTIRP